jgi:hypothetical protein
MALFNSIVLQRKTIVLAFAIVGYVVEVDK